MKRLVALLLLPSSAPAVTVAGSDIAGPPLAAELKSRVGAALVADFRGSFDGIRDLRTGKAVASLVFLRDGEKLPEVESGAWVAAPVAYQPVYVAVHNANKAEEIDLATLAGLYGDTPDIRYDTWECLPAAGMTQAPYAIAPHPGKGLTVSQFRAEVLGGGNYRKSVRFSDNVDSAEARAVSSPNSIVLLSRPPSTNNLRVLNVADGRTGRSKLAFAPTPSNLHSGDYPLRVTLYVVWPKAGAAAAKPVVSAILSSAAEKILTSNGLAPAPENIRKKFEQSLDS